MHIVIPYAGWQAGAADGLARPNLQAFLAASSLESSALPAAAFDFYLPHDVLLAQLSGLDGASTGTLPWAAWARAHAGLSSDGAWARISLCHWQMGMREARLHQPKKLALTEVQATAIWQSLGDWLAQDGITLVPSTNAAPYERHAQADWFADLPTVCMDRAAQDSLMDGAEKGRNAAAQKLARLQGEAQMLLYNHPANAEREAQRLAPINAFWLDGAGSLSAQPAQRLEEVRVLPALQNAAEASSLDSWRAAWLALDQDFFAPDALEAQLQKAGAEGLRISLCGLNRVQTCSYSQQSGLKKLKMQLLKSFKHFTQSNLPEQLLNL